ncbi:hypothetical protein HZY91_01015 [Facklamia sp. DSM 111018]|uniref:Exonuclease domain-containing protein n=1 Tax=Facklamia lactis TaxID=2749967 RepID=A0ABS0LQ28_9LACT|nr:exonuclease domain-containing protein [Facklamia lactis]MBG9985471.1 hypothetical protein [Facklamia lactis]
MKYAVVDLESTGPNIGDGDRIVQIGAVIVENNHIIAQHEMLINPECPLPPHIHKLTGIEEQELKTAPTFLSVAGLWYERLKDCIFIAHNLAHDLKFMQAHFEEAGYKYNPMAIDTVSLSKCLFPQSQGFNLIDLGNYLNLDYKNAHQALADANVTTQLLNKIAEKITQLNRETFKKLAKIATYFTHQEVLLFEITQSFLIEDYSQSTNDRSHALTACKDVKVINFELIQQKNLTFSHLIIEGHKRPISQLFKHQFYREIFTHQQEACLSFSSTKLLYKWLTEMKDFPLSEFQIILPKKYYLNLADFDNYCQKIDYQQLNQHELIVLGSCWVWLSETESGILSELNHEINIQEQIDKMLEVIDYSSKHYFYEKALQDIKQNHLILTINPFLSYLSRLSPDSVRPFNLKKYHLIVDNLSELNRQESFHNQIFTNLSQSLVQIQQLIDFDHQNIPQQNRNNSIYQQLVSFRSLFRELIDKIEQNFISQSPWTDRQQRKEFYLKDSSKILSEVLSIIEKLIKNNGLNNAIIEKYFPKNMQAKLIHLQNSIKNLEYLLIVSQKKDRGYYSVKMEQYQNHFYHIHLFWTPIRHSSQMSELFDHFNKVLLFSPGDTFYKQTIGSYHQLGLHSFKYYQLNQEKDLLQVQIPAAYLESKDQMIDSFGFQIEKLGILLNEQFPLTSKLNLIIVNNRQQAIDCYASLRHSIDAADQIRILSQHVSGSLNKIKRYVIEGDSSIVIIQWQSLLNHNWYIEDCSTSFYWMNLPFQSLKKSSIQAQAEVLKINEDQIFDQLLLPHMLNDLSVGIQYLRDYFNIQQAFLMDDRVFTKYYSKDIRQRLDESIQFNLQYDL